MFTVLITIHVLICFGLIISVLMQSAKGEGLAGAFGGGALSGAVFGGRGAASFLSKATTVLAIMFMGMCILLTLVTGGGRTDGVFDGASAVQQSVQGGADTPMPVSPSDVPAVNVGGEGGEALMPGETPQQQQQPGQTGGTPAEEPAGEGGGQ